MALYCELDHGIQSYKDMLKSNMKACDMLPDELQTLIADRSSWCGLFKQQTSAFEDRRVRSL